MQVRVLIGYQGKRTAVSLQKGQLLIGREGADIVLTDPHCSRRHAILYLAKDGSLHIKDLGSTNGTTLNGNKVTDSRIEMGQAIEIGNTHLAILDLWTSTILTGPSQYATASQVRQASGGGKNG